MANERPVKDNHLIYADAVGSRGKSGVWFGEQSVFKEHQSKIMEDIKDKIDWIPLDNAILAVSIDPPGICILTPNPSLPGIIVLADGATPENTAVIRERYIQSTKEVISNLGLKEQLEQNSETATNKS